MRRTVLVVDDEQNMQTVMGMGSEPGQWRTSGHGRPGRGFSQVKPSRHGRQARSRASTGKEP